MEDVQQLARDEIEYERSMDRVRYDHNKVIFARGWLIERARTKRLRKQLEEARDHADFWRHEALFRLDDDPAEVYGDDLPHSWEADQAAKGSE